MGQAICQTHKECLLKHPKVETLTSEHVILKDGTVLDPDDFVFFEDWVYLVQKLTGGCRCPGEAHPDGTHVVVAVMGGRNLSGKILLRSPLPAQHPHCH